MKKIILVIVLAIITLSANAQSAKPIMYAGFFNWDSNRVLYEDGRRVRSAILDGFVETQRFEIVDKNSEYQLNQEMKRRQSEGAMSDSTALFGQMVDLAADYILHGEITQFEAVPPTGTSEYYTGNISFTIKVNETKTKKLVAQESISIKDLKAGTGKTAEEAMTDAIKMIPAQIKDFVDENFKLKAVMLGEEYTVKGKKLATCIVTLGSDHGIKEGQKLEVFVINMIAGRQTSKVIGKLQVEEVLAGDLSTCKAIDGEEEMLVALKEYLDIRDSKPEKAKELQVQTLEKTGAGKFFRDMGGSLFK